MTFVGGNLSSFNSFLNGDNFFFFLFSCTFFLPFPFVLTMSQTQRKSQETKSNSGIRRGHVLHNLLYVMVERHGREAGSGAGVSQGDTGFFYFFTSVFWLYALHINKLSKHSYSLLKCCPS
jgi:hypothetical protein